MSFYKFTSMSDFETNGVLNWAAYHAAQEANGERCIECKAFIALGRGYPVTCFDCREAEKPGELRHDISIRCPQCGHKENGYDKGDSRLCAGGEHEVECSACETKYTVTTSVSFSFHSPARLVVPA